MKSLMSARLTGTVFTSQSRLAMVIYCLIGILLVGDLDYITGYQTSILTAYILPIGFGVIEVGPAFAVLLAVASVVISLATDLWDGVPSSEMPIHLFNKAVALVVFFISIALLQALKRILLRRGTGGIPS
jgi:hypothetical protein